MGAMMPTEKFLPSRKNILENVFYKAVKVNECKISVTATLCNFLTFRIYYQNPLIWYIDLG